MERNTSGLSGHPQDMTAQRPNPALNFFQLIYFYVRQIPCGKVATYGQLARLAGNPRMARQVGWALHQNPEPSCDAQAQNPVPCHRVVNRDGFLSGSFAFGGSHAQKELLEAEGVAVSGDNRVDLAIYLWEP